MAAVKLQTAKYLASIYADCLMSILISPHTIKHAFIASLFVQRACFTCMMSLTLGQ